MSAAELMPMIAALPSPEKFQLLQFLVTLLGKETGLLPFEAGKSYPIWTLYNIPEATSKKLEKMFYDNNHSLNFTDAHKRKFG